MQQYRNEFLGQTPPIEPQVQAYRYLRICRFVYYASVNMNRLVGRGMWSWIFFNSNLQCGFRKQYQYCWSMLTQHSNIQLCGSSQFFAPSKVYLKRSSAFRTEWKFVTMQKDREDKLQVPWDSSTLQLLALFKRGANCLESNLPLGKGKSLQGPFCHFASLMCQTQWVFVFVGGCRGGLYIK